MSKKEAIVKAPAVPTVTVEDLNDLAIAVFDAKSVDLSTLPPDIQRALKEFEVRELIGIAPSWKPEKPGEFLLGTVENARDNIGEFSSTVLTMRTIDGPKAVWLSTDMTLKLGENVDRMLGRSFVIQFEGWLTRAAMPRLKKDMRTFRIFEVGPRKTVASR